MRMLEGLFTNERVNDWTWVARFNKLAEYPQAHCTGTAVFFKKNTFNNYLHAQLIETQYTYFNTKLSFV